MDPQMMSMIMQMMNQGGGGNSFGSNVGNIFQGLFGNAGKPYNKAGRELDRYLPWAQAYQNPFWMAGASNLPGFQEWVGTMKDPTQFVNNLMGKYQESPWAQYQKDQAMRAAQNAGSASGLTGSTPMAQFMEQQAADISSKDMQNWLANVLGINTEYGAGLGGLISGGQQAVNALTNMMGDYMANKAKLAYGGEQAKQGQWGGLIGGLSHLFFG